MDSEKIDKLLEEYWGCNTTLAEEEALRKYFSTPGFDKKYHDTATLFHYCDIERRRQPPGDFDRQLLARLKKEEPSGTQGKVINLFGNIFRVAAVVSVIATAGYFMHQEMTKEENNPYLGDTFEDPKKAFEETKKALSLISENFNKGRKQAEKVAIFNEATQKIKEKN